MLIELLILILILGLIMWIARTVLGEPFHTAAMVVCVVILIVWLLRFANIRGVL